MFHRPLAHLAASTFAAMLLASSAHADGAPDFGPLLALDGSPSTEPLPIGQGQWTLLMIWASDCHVCRAQKPVISAFHDAHRDSDAQVVGLALDGPEGLDAVNAYLKQHQASFPNRVGELSAIAATYTALTEEPLRGTPTYLLFDPDGELVGNNPGPLSVAALESFIARH